MGYLGLGEPGLGSLIICAGVWINRNKHVEPLILKFWQGSFQKSRQEYVLEEASDIERAAANTSKRRLSNVQLNVRPSRWHRRRVHLFGFDRVVWTPNPDHWQQTVASRILHRFPFLIELVYWALIYGVSVF